MPWLVYIFVVGVASGELFSILYVCPCWSVGLLRLDVCRCACLSRYYYLRNLACVVLGVFSLSLVVCVSLRCVDLDCRIIVFRRQFTSSVYFLHATPPGLCHCRLIAWLVELVLFYHSMVAASRRLCNMFAFCRCYCPRLLGSLALCARPLACSCLYQSSPPS